MHDYRDRVIEIGLRFHRYFKGKGMTGQKVAERMGISQSRLSALVDGTDFNLSFIYAIRDHFPDLNIKWLLTGEGKPEANDPTQFDVKHLHTQWAVSLDEVAKEPTPKLDKIAKAKVAELANLLDEGIAVRALLLAHIADLQNFTLNSVFSEL